MVMPHRSLQRKLNALLQPTAQPSFDIAFVRPDATLTQARGYAVPDGEAWSSTSRRWLRRAVAAVSSMTFLSAGVAAYAVFTLGHHPVPLNALPSWSQGWVAAHAQQWPSEWWPSPVVIPTVMPVPTPTLSALATTGVQAAMPTVDPALEARKRQEAARQAKLLNRQEVLADVITTQYYIAHEAALLIVQQAFQAADAHHVDPLLLLAVTGVESHFNPFAGSNAGALGLTQSLPGAHPDKMRPLHQRGGSILNVRDNLDLGAQILREYLVQYHDNVVLALQQYNGSLNDPRRAYSNRVLKAMGPLKAAAERADRTFRGA